MASRTDIIKLDFQNELTASSDILPKI